MSNTYFKIKKTVKNKGLEPSQDYTNNYELSLTAFVGGENHTQLTVTTNSNIPNQSGCGYIVLGDKEVDLLIAGLLERKLNKISATGYEQSVYSPYDDIKTLPQ